MTTTAQPPLPGSARLRLDFPSLAQPVHGRRLAYLDNAATTQRPQPVIDRMVRYAVHEHANVHRGVHERSARASGAYEGARETVRRFIGAASAREVIFVAGATAGINLVAQTFGRLRVGPGDEVLVSGMEHHSNLLPWQQLCRETGGVLRVIPVTDAGDLDLAACAAALSARTRLVTVTHVSHVLGTVNPVAEIVREAHVRDIPVLIDGAQAVAHRPVDVQRLGCDFYVFSGHKVFGPTGVGVLYAQAQWLDLMPPWQTGGGMVGTVTWDAAAWADAPQRFEAGTPCIESAVGLAAALDYLEALDLSAVAAYEGELRAYAVEALAGLPGVQVVGAPRERAGIVSFLVRDVHAHDVATVLDRAGVAVRAGHHCGQPLMARLGVPATVRASFAIYNGRDDVDALVSGLRDVRRIFG